MPRSTVAEVRADATEQTGVRAVQELVGRGDAEVRVQVGTVVVSLPRPLVQVLAVAAESLGSGDMVAVLREDAEVSPAEAARLLGVSRQYVDRLIGAGVLPARRLPGSTYRKIPARAVLAHKETSTRKRAGIETLVDEALDAGLTY